MRERVEHGIFGYSNKTDGYYDAVCAWFARRQDWAIERDWVVTTPGVVPTLNVVVRGFTAPGDRVIVQRPVYYPFFRVAKNNGRSEEHTSELQSLMRISYAVFCLKKKKKKTSNLKRQKQNSKRQTQTKDTT